MLAIQLFKMVVVISCCDLGALKNCDSLISPKRPAGSQNIK